jgi:calnexin
MRFNAALAPALCASALLAGTAFAQEEAETSTSVVERPTFTVCLVSVFDRGL